MMKWFLEEKIEPYSKKIKHGDGIVLMGSCFSQNIYDKGRDAGLNFYSPELGTLFHPKVLFRIIYESLYQEGNEKVFLKNERYFSWDAGHKISADTCDELNMHIGRQKNGLLDKLKKANYLFLTFGTSKGYQLKNGSGMYVANCHKFPPDHFTSQLTPLEDMMDSFLDVYEYLLKECPNLEIVLTVSPVRHAKDGLVTNNRSKARLLMLCEELSKIDRVSYFPSYEMIMDELRDYRFFGPDKVHPNEEAINYIWEKFSETYFSVETKELVDRVNKFRSYFSHRPINPPTEKEKAIYTKKKSELESFLKSNPDIFWYVIV